MRNYLQTSFIPQSDLKVFKKLSHGGSKKKRKTKRPLIPNAITHVVFKSSKATGARSFYKNRNLVKSLVETLSKKYFIEVKDFVNMGNHLHLKVKFKDTKRFQNFLRVFTGLLARKIAQAHRGSVFGKFWDALAYTRIITTKIEELGLKIYFEGNHRERELGYADRAMYLKSWNQFLHKLRCPTLH